MDPSFRETLASGARALGLDVPPQSLPLLERFADRLLAWNRKVNLTAITTPAEVAEKHLLDSLLLLRSLGGARSLLDVGSGGGLPGVVLACVRPELEVVCCDSVAKKVAFVKTVAVELGLARVRGVVVRATGRPEADGLPRCEAVVSRAVAEPAVWVPLGSAYLSAGGTLIAMLGRAEDEERLAELGSAAGLELVGFERHELPFSRSARAIARWTRKGIGSA
jgi:16S rRNA (guanine527-N7)-methyltransferase